MTSAIVIHWVGGEGLTTPLKEQLELKTNTYGPSEPVRANNAGCEVYTWADEQEYRNWLGDLKSASFLGVAGCGKPRAHHWQLYAVSKEAMTAAIPLVHKIPKN